MPAMRDAQKLWFSHLPITTNPGSASYERIPTEYNGDNNPVTPLLSAALPTAVDDEAIISVSHVRRPKSWARRHQCLIGALVALVLIGVAFAQRGIERKEAASSATPEEAPSPAPEIPDQTPSPLEQNLNFDNPVIAARVHVDELFARQSQTIEHASARYSLKTGRPPPRGYERWFEFAREKSCLIDEYDQVHRDFAPFYQLAEDDPLFFQRMIDVAANMMKENPKEMAAIEIRGGEVYMPEIESTAYWDTWPITFSQFAPYLPDITFLINGRDEPRVVFDYRESGARSKALTVTEDIPFDVSPHPTSDFFRGRSGCDILSRPEGFTETANDDSAFFISSAKTEFTVDLYPMLSMTKVSPCFADILFPIEYYYDRSWWSGKFAYPDNVEWADKKSQICASITPLVFEPNMGVDWRGTSSGGQIFGYNYYNFTRFKLIELAREHGDLIDVAMTSFADELCGNECDRENIIAEYNITGEGEPREDGYQYKSVDLGSLFLAHVFFAPRFLLDVDGTTFSGRYLGLLRSGSLVFKATVFEEYFNEWLRPFEHYIPVLPDLSDLTEKLEWALEHDAEARMIQERGREMSQRVMTDAQNDCYFFAVLLEWARLQEISRNATEAGP
ncbi:glycosyl transferase family 90-domain-containing protein [Mycena maculata]|uniref:Glycosyl transferase family 90-domain-containing protein n=1 Tax=Mycena maculata TaxID=230809 RepID=A0AAD7J4E2_9AGAR|nr:glycosyl transferase family 90-domain-containing protein [Mycena maculata]